MWPKWHISRYHIKVQINSVFHTEALKWSLNSCFSCGYSCLQVFNHSSYDYMVLNPFTISFMFVETCSCPTAFISRCETDNEVYLPSLWIKNIFKGGHLSVVEHDSWSWGHGFEPHIGGRDYLKSIKIYLYISINIFLFIFINMLHII